MLALMAAWRWLTSYPMTRQRGLFIDPRGSHLVGLFVDRHGRQWTAIGPWSLDRQPYNENDKDPRG